MQRVPDSVAEGMSGGSWLYYTVVIVVLVIWFIIENKEDKK